MKNNNNILLAGGKGFIGSYLYSQLRDRASITSLGYINDSTKINMIDLNLNDINEVDEFADNCNHFTVLIFLVGLVHAKGKGKDFPEFKKVNYQTLVNLLSALKNNNKVPEKIIFASTISVYGERYDQNQYVESLEPNPFSPYAVTKLKAEQYLLDKYADKSWILRFAPVYSSTFLLNINRRTKMGKMFYKIGKGQKRLSLCNINNIKSAVEGIIDGIVPAGLYNISDLKPYSYNDLLKHQDASGVLRIPALAIRLLYVLGKMTKNIFLKENSVKLITDNVFPSDKIRSFVNLPSTINDVIGND